nr:hypothetical protein [Oscillospiraceae bacterium]
MRKFLAMLLSLLLVCSMSTAALAADGELKTETHQTNVKLHKIYTVTGEKDAEGAAVPVPALYPAETLNFVSEPAVSNPDYDAGNKEAMANLRIAPLQVSGNTNQDIVITLPEYTKVGIYTYTISETPPDPNTQGVGYTDAQITVTVLVEYNQDHTALKSTLYLTQEPGAGETGSNVGTADQAVYKVDTFTNTYDVGHLDVTKTVSGNLADQTKEFNVDVTFTSPLTAASKITYVDDGAVKTISADEQNAEGGKTVTITLKHGETVHFYNIPAGVTYTVKEQDYTGGELNGENGYDEPTYLVNPDPETNEVGQKSAAGVSETAEKNETDVVKINNNKDTDVSTGIVLDSLPYILMLTCAFAGLIALFGKKRYEV